MLYTNIEIICSNVARSWDGTIGGKGMCPNYQVNKSLELLKDFKSLKMQNNRDLEL